ncbi:MAG: hypothetical protein JWN40_3558 [Phycisphaerales bacterium]|nr:hypothetical protein [Phycisphaerales bacterium]
MISVHEAISRFRRDVTLSTLLKAALGCGVGAVLALHFVSLGKTIDPSLLLMGLGAVWLTLWYRTMKGSRLAAQSSTLIASGNLEQAEAQIEQSLRAFSMSRSVKSMGLLNLALVRLAQKRWPDTAMLCREVLAAKKGTSEHVNKSGRLMLADSLLEMGDLRGAHEALAGLYNHRLTLSEALSLLRVQTEYLARVGAWEQMIQGAVTKVALAEIMPMPNGARVQAMLALAAKRTGRAEWANWLRRRVELLVDVQELATQRPLLWELWEK